MTETQHDRVLSGTRPTGRLHLGHLHGALLNWVSLQEQYECYFFVADWHALTSEYENSGVVAANVRELVADWLGAGLDPERATLFVQSRIKEHAELFLILGMITPLGWLERNPTYKEMQENLTAKDLGTFGFLGYPVLQASDILAYRAQHVPVGVDQLPHLEITREIARRFNFLFRNTFPEPQALLTKSPKVVGTDGRKMSKSYGNTLDLGDSPDTLRAKVKTMFTDPQRKRRNDPGDPEVCPVYHLHRLYHPSTERVEEIGAECRSAKIGCVDCKKEMVEHLVTGTEPIRERRAAALARPGYIEDVLEHGNLRARQIAARTLDDVRAAVGLPTGP
jgi:tryptophanyl-tRNA synthetase